MKLLHNHLGFEAAGPKVALLQADAPIEPRLFALVPSAGGAPVFEGRLAPLAPVPGWQGRHYAAADFSALQAVGDYGLQLGEGASLVAAPLTIRAEVFDESLQSDLVHYFKSQRCSGIFDAADRSCPVFGSEQRVDVHGGWYDASGDASKYLSHLSYANFMNPQQTPQVVWNLIAGLQQGGAVAPWLAERTVDEALHGADFLCRMQHDDSWFYMTVFDRWTKDVTQRRLCSYTTQQGHLFASYQAGFRQGGGCAIAALARASTLPRDGEFPRSHCLAAAQRGFAHLQQHNAAYLDDGRENILDDYCALLAACELWSATCDERYHRAATDRAHRLIARQHADGWFWADDDRTRSYFHAVDAGLPLVALLRYLDLAPDDVAVRDGVRRALRHELRITNDGAGNPFGYPRQWVQAPGEPGRAQFFIPHHNDSGYWWQGENARLGSLAAAALAAERRFGEDASLRSYARSALDWIFGRNPFDTCMMQGRGRGHPHYEPGYWNAPGGVCNGITAGLDDEADIDFRAPHETTPMHSWRWREQWLPHGAWLFLALAWWRAR
ncbi:glycoside hydrolase family 9 protein [Aquincola sp. S2]|uniref:Glycoside hydrolase family 9 protein n=1 Tax=Pseudaquabacterium terrae TaxID=2732868 RepID=A0ABX2ES47_9BURK|nr:glycoside hydrolase family 9 protein [Aquabacterium terrae]NRF71565.1 glycoside hydrolase family 9 protein [Aquabacterium terrae]